MFRNASIVKPAAPALLVTAFVLALAGGAFAANQNLRLYLSSGVSFNDFRSPILMWDFKKNLGFHLATEIQFLKPKQSLYYGIEVSLSRFSTYLGVYNLDKEFQFPSDLDLDLYPYRMNPRPAARWTSLIVFPRIGLGDPEPNQDSFFVDAGLGLGNAWYRFDRIVPENVPLDSYNWISIQDTPYAWSMSEFLHNMKSEMLLVLGVRAGRTYKRWRLALQLQGHIGLRYSKYYEAGWSGGGGSVDIWEDEITKHFSIVNVMVQVSYRIF